MTKPMVIVFVLLEVDATLGNGCRISEHLCSFWKMKFPRFYDWLYKIYVGICHIYM